MAEETDTTPRRKKSAPEPRRRITSRFRMNSGVTGIERSMGGGIVGGYTPDGLAFGTKERQIRSGGAPAAPATTPGDTAPAVGNILNARQNLFKRMQEAKTPEQLAVMRKEAASLGVTDMGWQRATSKLQAAPATTAAPSAGASTGGGEIRRIRDLPDGYVSGGGIPDDAIVPPAQGGDQSAAAMGTPEQQAAVRQMMEEGAGMATASTGNDVSNQAAAAMAGRSRFAVSPQRVLLTPQQSANEAGAANINDLPTDERMRIQGKTNAGQAEVAANKAAVNLAKTQGVDPLSLKSKFRTNLQQGSSERVSPPIGKTPEGMELVGMKSGVPQYAPMQEVYGEAPTGRTVNPQATAPGSNRITAPVVNPGRTAEDIRGDYQRKMQPAPTAAPTSRFRIPQGPASQQQPTGPTTRPDGYKSRTYDERRQMEEESKKARETGTLGSMFRRRGQPDMAKAFPDRTANPPGLTLGQRKPLDQLTAPPPKAIPVQRTAMPATPAPAPAQPNKRSVFARR
jgi:hypothetical protein